MVFCHSNKRKPRPHLRDHHRWERQSIWLIPPPYFPCSCRSWPSPVGKAALLVHNLSSKYFHLCLAAKLFSLWQQLQFNHNAALFKSLFHFIQRRIQKPKAWYARTSMAGLRSSLATLSLCLPRPHCSCQNVCYPLWLSCFLYLRSLNSTQFLPTLLNQNYQA